MKMCEEKAVCSLRPLTCEVGHLTRPDGSVTILQGDTCVMTAVYGPAEVRMNKEQIDKATVDVVFKPKSGLPGCVEKSTEELLCNTCQTVLLASLHPRSAINLTVQEVQNSGSLLAACINSCCLALLDASISMRFTMAAVSCCLSQDGELVVDPSLTVEQQCRSGFTFVFDSKNKDVITVYSYGKFTSEEFQTSLVTCREASSHVFNFYRETMERKLSKSV